MDDILKKDFSLSKVQAGHWYIIHKWAITSKTIEDRLAYCALIKFISLEFICLECRAHFAEYIKHDPPELYVDTARKLFFWSWKVHNYATTNVNKKRKPEDAKPEMGFDDAVNLWSSTEGCDNCAVMSIEQQEQQQQEQVLVKKIEEVRLVSLVLDREGTIIAKQPISKRNTYKNAYKK